MIRTPPFVDSRLAVLLAVALGVSCGAYGPSVDDLRSDPHGHLIWAARTGQVADVRTLATRGIDLDASTKTPPVFVFPDLDHVGWTALQHAVQKHHAEVVRELLEWGANPDATAAGTVNTPLYIAAFDPDPATTRLLLDAGADVNLTRKAFLEDRESGPVWQLVERASVRMSGTLSRREALERMRAVGLTELSE